MVFTFYLSDLVYWVGFVTGLTFTTHLWIVDFIGFLTLWWKTVFSSELLFFRIKVFFFCKLVIFHCFSPNPYTRRWVSTIGSLSLFRETVRKMVNYQSYLGFLGFLWFSISLFILIIYKGNRFSLSASSYQLVPTYRTVLRTVRKKR